MTDNASDAELEAIQRLISALEPLEKDARIRVIDYVFRRLGVEGRPAGHDMSFLMPPPAAGTPNPPAGSLSPPINDIRSLKAQKNPQSAIEMAAVAAYYLSEVAPAGHRKSEISASDIEAL